jgi:hypothetical protein
MVPLIVRVVDLQEDGLDFVRDSFGLFRRAILRNSACDERMKDASADDRT